MVGAFAWPGYKPRRAMIVAQGRIAALDGQCATVVVAQATGCRGCAGHKSCGFALPRNGAHALSLSGDAPCVSNRLRVGDTVTVAIAERTLLAGITWAYGVPLLALLAGLLIGGRWGEPASAVGTVIGAALGFALLRWHGRRAGAMTGYRPVIAATEPAPRDRILSLQERTLSPQEAPQERAAATPAR